ncbi:MAG: hypothetical protein JSW58_03535 [Candidatus Latescibacterota bacterium]|nr:MAG: hypothetical protein JSW58_03535 [Candidatus Latescibacterota bacterium]
MAHDEAGTFETGYWRIVKRVPLIILVVGLLGFPLVGWAQLPTTPPEDSDTTSTEVPSYTKLLKYDGTIKGNVTNVSLSNRATGTLAFTNGMTFITMFSAEESHYRIQDRISNMKIFSTNMVYPINSALNMDGTLSDNRFFNRVITGSNATQDLMNNSQTAKANLQFKRRIAMLALNSKSSVSATKSEQTFQNTQTEEGAIAGQIQYVKGKRFSATARGFVMKSFEKSDVQDRNFGGLGADEDSVSAKAMITISDSSTVQVRYMRYTKTHEYLNQPSGVHGGTRFDADLRAEFETKDVDALRFEAETYPLPGVKLGLVAEHRDDAEIFTVDDKRSKINVSDYITADLTYKPSEKTMLTAKVENRESTSEFPTKPGTFDDEHKRITLNWNQTISSTLRFTAQSGISLVQTFYIDTDSDRDQRYQFASMRLSSDLFPKVKATVFVEAAKTDKLNIRSSRSQNNETETRFDLRPEFTYRINDRITLTQKYGLNIEFSEFLFQEDQNFLDRNITFSNTVDVRLTPALSTEVFYSYLLHSKGSYLRPEEGGERLLEIDQKDRRDEIEISFKYQINKHLALVGANDYSQRKDLFAPAGSGAFKNGGLEIGVEGNYEFGAQRGLTFVLRRVKRFGRFNSPEQQDFWVMDSSLNYTF